MPEEEKVVNTSPITLQKEVTYEDLKVAHEKAGDTSYTGPTEEELYPKLTVQKDAIASLTEKFQTASTYPDVEEAQAKTVAAKDHLELTLPQLDKVRDAKDEVLETLASIDILTLEGQTEEAVSGAIFMAEKSLYTTEPTPADLKLIEATTNRLTKGESNDGARNFVNALGSKAGAATESPINMVAIDHLLKIATSETADLGIALLAAINISDIKPSRLTATNVEVLSKLITIPPEKEEDADRFTVLERIQDRTVALAFISTYSAEPTQHELALQDAVVDAITRGEVPNASDFIEGLKLSTRETDANILKTAKAIKNLFAIAESDTAGFKDRQSALNGISNTDSDRFTQEEADIISRYFDISAPTDDEFKEAFQKQAKAKAIEIALKITFLENPSPIQLGILKSAIKAINDGDPLVTTDMIGILEERCGATDGNDQIKRLCAQPFKYFIEGRSKNQTIPRMDRKTVSKLAFPI